MSEKKLANGKGYSTDLHQLASDLLDQKMKTYIVYNAEEHDQTRGVVKSLEDVIRESGSSRIHNIVQDVVIALIALGMIIFLTGC